MDSEDKKLRRLYRKNFGDPEMQIDEVRGLRFVEDACLELSLIHI